MGSCSVSMAGSSALIRPSYHAIVVAPSLTTGGGWL
jgi:hypothetical protein